MAYKIEVLQVGNGACVGPHKPGTWELAAESRWSFTVSCPVCSTVERETFGHPGSGIVGGPKQFASR